MSWHVKSSATLMLPFWRNLVGKPHRDRDCGPRSPTYLSSHYLSLCYLVARHVSEEGLKMMLVSATIWLQLYEKTLSQMAQLNRSQISDAQKPWEIRNDNYSFKPLNFGVICYTAVGNYHLLCCWGYVLKIWSDLLTLGYYIWEELKVGRDANILCGKT